MNEIMNEIMIDYDYDYDLIIIITANTIYNIVSHESAFLCPLSTYLDSGASGDSDR